MTQPIYHISPLARGTTRLVASGDFSSTKSYSFSTDSDDVLLSLFVSAVSGSVILSVYTTTEAGEVLVDTFPTQVAITPALIIRRVSTILSNLRVEVAVTGTATLEVRARGVGGSSGSGGSGSGGLPDVTTFLREIRVAPGGELYIAELFEVRVSPQGTGAADISGTVTINA